MPHFGLILDELPKDKEALLRAKLHMRGGDMRSERGQYVDAVAAYYDAVSHAMMHFFLSKSLKRKYNLPEVSDLEDGQSLFKELKRARVIDDTISQEDFDWICTLLVQAFQDDINQKSVQKLESILENLMVQLQVLPLDEGELPEGLSVTL
ncbi:MAG: hypothetical protein ACFFDR_03675 [Candidatus Thorarchaeota archaeon]